jgi:hypothetical protein
MPKTKLPEDTKAPIHCPKCASYYGVAIPAGVCTHQVENALDKMQEALDTLVDLAVTEKSIWLADAIDHLAVAIQYTRTATE